MGNGKAVVIGYPGQSCLRGRITGKEYRGIYAQLRLHHKAHHQVQAGIPPHAGQLLRLQPLFAIAGQVPIADCHRVKTGIGLHRIPVGKHQGALATEPTADQVRHLGHQLPVVKTFPVPLQHREFRVVAAPALAIPEHPGNLENRAGTGRQQPFHMVFGGSLQPAGRDAGRIDRSRDAVQVHIGYAMAAKHRGFHLQHLPLCKKAAHVCQ